MKTYYNLTAFAGNLKQQIAFCLFCSFILFCNVSRLQAQVTVTWDKALGGTQYDVLQYQQKTTDGGYILGGSSYSPVGGSKTSASKGNADYWIIKVDAAGNKKWDKTFGGRGRDFLKSMQQTTDGGYILAGYSDSPAGGDKTLGSLGSFDYWIVKIDASGKKQWDKTFIGLLDDFLVSIQQTSDKGYILGGTSASPRGGRWVIGKGSASNGEKDYWVIKVDASGEKQWDQSYGGKDFDFLQTVKQTRDKGYILGGYSYSASGGTKTGASKGLADYWVVKIDANGKHQWNKTLGGTKEDILRCVEPTDDEGYILGGTSTSPATGNKTQGSKGESDYWVVKLDSKGGKLWDKTIGGRNNDDLHSIKQTLDGGFIVGGQSSSPVSGNKTEPSKGNSDFWIVKLNDYGQVLWDKTIGGNKEDGLQSVQQIGKAEYMLGGYSKSAVSKDRTASSNGGYDFWIVKVKENNGSDDVSAGYWLKTSTLGQGAVYRSLSSDANSYIAGSVIALTAKPAPGYRFAGWDGNASGVQNPLTITMNGNKNIVAVFAPIERNQYEAEEASLNSAVVKKEHAGYRGSGYVDFVTDKFAGINWKVDGKEGVHYDITFRYANGLDKSLPLIVLVNTFIIEEAKPFAPTGGWQKWSEVKMRVVLKEGQNTIIIKTIGQGGPNVDYIKVATSVNGPGTMAQNIDLTSLLEQPADSADMVTGSAVKFKAVPNPFFSNVAFTFTFAKEEAYQLNVYDLSGMPVKSFKPGTAKANEEVSIDWSPDSLQPGIYIVKLVTNSGVQTFRIVCDNDW